MNSAPRPLILAPGGPDAGGPPWRRDLARWGGAVALHLLPLALLATALPLKPKDLGGAFGQSISVTLVSGAPARAAAPRATQGPSLAALEQRLSDHGPTAAEAPPPTPARSSAPTRLSDLFDGRGETAAQAAQGSPRAAPGDDDPFARASVSYRGEDPAKTAWLRSKARGCARTAKSLRLLLIINSQGDLVARPRLLGAAVDDAAVQKAIGAIERCAPFPDAATPGPPRSYEVELG